MRICKLCLLNTKQHLLVDYCFGKVTKIMWITFCLKYICGLNYKMLSTSPSNMPHLIYFIPALFLLLRLNLFPHRQPTFGFLLLYSPMTLPSHCESTSTPEALKSHQALLHLSLHYCLHLKIVPFLCVSVTLIPSTAAVLSQVPLSSVVTFLWEAPICQSVKQSHFLAPCCRHPGLNLRQPGARARHWLHHRSSSITQSLVVMVNKQ